MERVLSCCEVTQHSHSQQRHTCRKHARSHWSQAGHACPPTASPARQRLATAQRHNRLPKQSLAPQKLTAEHRQSIPGRTRKQAFASSSVCRCVVRNVTGQGCAVMAIHGRQGVSIAQFSTCLGKLRLVALPDLAGLFQVLGGLCVQLLARQDDAQLEVVLANSRAWVQPMQGAVSRRTATYDAALIVVLWRMTKPGATATAHHVHRACGSQQITVA